MKPEPLKGKLEYCEQGAYHDHFINISDEKEAAEAYNSKAKQLFGEYAKLNDFIEEEHG